MHGISYPLNETKIANVIIVIMVIMAFDVVVVVFVVMTSSTFSSEDRAIKLKHFLKQLPSSM